ncbi:hypothetical protein JCGZ_08568 [Jatropha curcas]|uniref:Uncharacterized protein n=1 Tax=Jatropha curcas TaxID=180498 RepID=A0A067KQW3_JATCU|nr:hypothetical protein JCGZ_08568 [Jatropha curcas]
MRSSSDEDMRILADQSEDEIMEAIESRVGEAKGRLENIRVTEIPYDIGKGKLLAITSKYDLALEYKLTRPESDMRINTPLDSKSIMLYEESFRFGFRFPLFEPLRSSFNEYEITISQLHRNGLRLLCGIVELAHRDWTTLTARGMRVLYHMYNRGCILENQMVPNGPKWRRPTLVSPRCELTPISTPAKPSRKRQREVSASIPPPPSQEDRPNREMAWHCLFPTDVRYFETMDDLEGSIAEDLTKACLSLKANILTKLKARNSEENWSWVNEIYPDDDDEEEDELAISDLEVGDLPPLTQAHQETQAQGSAVNLDTNQQMESKALLGVPFFMEVSSTSDLLGKGKVRVV